MPVQTATPSYEESFRLGKTCVLIPTYNNAATLPGVLRDVLAYTRQVIVVNDGSTDNTAAVLQEFPEVQLISYGTNRGKGYALRTGLRAARERGYDYAVVMDSDGQHYAHDLPKFLEQIKAQPGALVIGARNLDQENVPTKSSFGNRFSNFWFWVNTGIRLPDTQSGYRLYPLEKIAKKTYFTTKYEFEIEVIVRAAWSGVPVTYIPISVYYPPADERISHFRPFKDFTRISILNTFLVLTALLWIKPRDFVKMLFSRDGWRKLWDMIFHHPEESNQRKACSVAFGIFMGIVPVWGFQLVIGIPLAVLMRLNKALFLVAANISIFPFTAFIWLGSLATGKWLLGYRDWSLDWRGLTLARVKQEGLAFFLGGSVLAIAAAVAAYVLTWLGLTLFRRRRNRAEATT